MGIQWCSEGRARLSSLWLIGLMAVLLLLLPLCQARQLPLWGGLPETGSAFDGQGQGREDDSSQPSKLNKQNRPPSSPGDDLPSVRDGKIGQDRPGLGLEKDS